MHEEMSLAVRGATLPYTDCGRGVPVVLLHGAATDHRMWREHAEILSVSHRVIAPSQRYHGTGQWSDAWPRYGVPTHAADLVAFVEALDAGPVHLAAWSYACQVAFEAMVQAPHLFASVFAYEPGHPSWLRADEDIKLFEQDAYAAFGPIFDAVGRGDNDLALERLLDAAGGRPGYFASQPAAVRRGQQDNARTLPLLLAQEPARILSVEDLQGAGVPLQVAYGSRTGAMYRLVGAALPGSRIVEGASHMWPQEDPRAFCAQFIDWLAR